MTQRPVVARPLAVLFLLPFFVVAGCDDGGTPDPDDAGPPTAGDAGPPTDDAGPPVTDDAGPPVTGDAGPPVTGGGVETALGETAPVSADGYDFAALRAALDANADTLGGGGGLLLIHHGQVVFRHTVGVAPEGGPFTPDTVVPLASASKWISGGVIGALVERGELGWDLRAGDVFTTWEGDKASMTVGQLFSHTAGLNNGPEVHRVHSLENMRVAVDRIYAEVPIEYLPGTELWYAGVGMQVAGRMAEIRHGDAAWVDVADEVLLGPLGMTSTHYYGYVGPNFGVPTDNPNVAGTAATSLNEYARYVWMLHNGGRFGETQVLRPETIEQMFTSRSDFPLAQVRLTPWDPYFDVAPEFEAWRTGIGTWLYRNPETGETEELISGGAWGCMPFIDRTRDLVGVYLPYQRQRETAPGGGSRNPATVFWLSTVRPLLRAAIDDHG